MSIIPATLCLFLLTLAHFGCTGRTAEAPVETAVVAIENGPLTLDPRYATDAIGSQIGDLIFDGLTALDDQARHRPNLARDWVTPDPLTFEFHLHDGFRFHNGTNLTAADVKATYDAVRSDRSASPKRESLRAIESIEVPDPLTVRFHLREPFAAFLDATTLGIMPADALAGSPTRPIDRPVGSGPFQLVEVVPDERIELRRFAGYGARPTRLAGVEFRVIPDGLVRLLEVRSGGIDLIQNALEPDAVKWLQTRADVTVSARPGTSFQYLGLNLREPHLADVRVRQALAYAIDRSALIRSVLRGLATPATGLLAPTHWAYSGDVVAYPHNPKRAAELLDEAGYPDPDGDGPEVRFRLSYKTTTADMRKRIAEAIQSQLRRVGVGLDIRTYEWGTFYGDIKRGDFHMYSLQWVGVADPDIYFLTCHSSQVPPVGNNRGFVGDATMDDLTDRARHTLDVDARRGMYVEVQRRAAELLPVVPLWWTTNVAVTSRRLHGYELRTDGSLVALRDAWIEEH